LWTARNQAVADYPGFCSIGAVMLRFENAAAVLAKRAGASTYFRDQWEKQYLREHPDQVNWTRGSRWIYEAAEAKQILRDNWRLYLPIHLRGMANTLLGPLHVWSWADSLVERIAARPSATEASAAARPDMPSPPPSPMVGLYGGGPVRSFPLATRILTKAALVFNGLLILLATIGACRCRPWSRPALAAMLGSGLVAWFAAGGPDGTARYRAPFAGVLCLLAGLGVTEVIERLGSARRLVPSAGTRV
jgi:hypothetical protein